MMFVLALTSPGITLAALVPGHEKLPSAPAIAADPST
jgi:hypothetical protein